MPEDSQQPTPAPPASQPNHPPQPNYPPQTPFAQAMPAYAGPYPNARAPYAVQPARPGWFWPLIVAGSILLAALLFGLLVRSAFKTMNDSDAGSDSFSSSKIAVIDIDGVILDADKVDTQLRKFGDDSDVKAIILHINSPGGGAAASQEIYHEVLRIRTEKKKKVIASVESVGASGAYYIASGCDRIYANDASVVGSIGVIMEWTNYGDLMKWAKLKPVVIHAGALKDAGDPTHDMTPQEAAYFQSLVDNMYTQFVDDVAAGRHTSPDVIRPLATGQVWTGQQSLPLGLIDKIGGYRVALMDTAKDAGISGEPSVVKPASAKKGLAALLSGDSDELFPNPGKLLDRSPGFFFLWK